MVYNRDKQFLMVVILPSCIIKIWKLHSPAVETVYYQSVHECFHSKRLMI